MNVAHALSHLSKIEKTMTRNAAEEYIRFVASTAVPHMITAEEIKEESAVDEELENLRRCIETGNWENASCSGSEMSFVFLENSF